MRANKISYIYERMGTLRERGLRDFESGLSDKEETYCSVESLLLRVIHLFFIPKIHEWIFASDLFCVDLAMGRYFSRLRQNKQFIFKLHRAYFYLFKQYIRVYIKKKSTKRHIWHLINSVKRRYIADMVSPMKAIWEQL